MKHFIQSTVLATFLLSPAAAFAASSFAASNGDTCGCHGCHGKDGKCDKKSCQCKGDCECKKGGECKAGCTCGKKSKKPKA
ncbi:MAG: hypothetical protein KIT72_16600 [Polyangiaceae bacterium]|nr:hypothetical protein [Polyangiaceae bacterium]MCW5792038.1 hypothetical protein [Polyangiaceae bacterium]